MNGTATLKQGANSRRVASGVLVIWTLWSCMLHPPLVRPRDVRPDTSFL